MILDCDRGGTARDTGLTEALIRALLEHPEGHPWVMQDIGLLGLRLDQDRRHRLHIWDPDRAVCGPLVHDHPFDFTSWVVAGEITNTRYWEDATGAEYHRVRYRADDEEDRRSDTVRLVGRAETLTAGDRYALRSAELHDSGQQPGTVTVISRRPVEVTELTVCRPDDGPWVSGRSRPATPAEVRRITGLALSWF